MTISTTSSTLLGRNRNRIGPEDIIQVRGKYLTYPNGTRFFMKGIAFPATEHGGGEEEDAYNASAWIDVLHQLVIDLNVSSLNTVRLYRMNSTVDYTDFFQAAAQLGIYVIVPLTSAKGDGVMDRTLPAPACYNETLFRFGISAIQNYIRYPNCLAGMIGNEVINSMDAWQAAPCIKAYARDLKRYMKMRQQQQQRSSSSSNTTTNTRTSNHRILPLLYAAENSGIGAMIRPVQSMRLQTDYLTCTHTTDDEDDMDTQNHSDIRISSAGEGRGTNVVDDNEDDDARIDIFGVNIESWCSSLGTFLTDEKGWESPYHELYQGMWNVSVPLVFSEMGCSHIHFDRDNGLADSEGTRDWKQVPVVLNEMADAWSGFSAYAYWGNREFNMFEGGPWDGKTLLQPTKDFYNFRQQVNQAHVPVVMIGNNNESHNSSSSSSSSNSVATLSVEAPLCTNVQADLKACCDIDLFDIANMPSYTISPFDTTTTPPPLQDTGTPSHTTHQRAEGTNASAKLSFWMGATLLLVLGSIFGWKVRRQHKPGYQTIQG